MGIYTYRALGKVVVHSRAWCSRRSVGVDVSGQGYDVVGFLLRLLSFLFCTVVRFCAHVSGL